MNHFIIFRSVGRECGKANLIIADNTFSRLREVEPLVDTQPDAARNFRSARTARPILATAQCAKRKPRNWAGADVYSKNIFFLGRGGSVFASAGFLRLGRGASLVREELSSAGAPAGFALGSPRGGRGTDAGAAGACATLGAGAEAPEGAAASAAASLPPSGFAPPDFRGRRRRRFFGAVAGCPSSATFSSGVPGSTEPASKAPSLVSTRAGAACGAGFGGRGLRAG